MLNIDINQFGGYNNTQFNAKLRVRDVRALGPRICYIRVNGT